jgi:hypothetical protein
MIEPPYSAYSKETELVKQLFEINSTTYFLTPFGGFFSLNSVKDHFETANRLL